MLSERARNASSAKIAFCKGPNHRKYLLYKLRVLRYNGDGSRHQADLALSKLAVKPLKTVEKIAIPANVRRASKKLRSKARDEQFPRVTNDPFAECAMT